MSRAKLFIENFFAYGFIQVLNKIIPFLFLPVITRLLPNTSDFGVYDMFNLIIGLGTPFVILGLSDAMFREFFEKDELQYRYNVTASTQKMVFFSSLIISILLIIFNKFLSRIILNSELYGNIIIFSGITVFLHANLQIIQSPTRIQNQRKVFIYSGLLSSFSQYAISLLLIYLGFSYFGLIYASIMTSIIMIVFFWIKNKNFFLLGKFDRKIAKELLKIGLPLLPTFLIYWIYKSMDRIMITRFLGLSELGIYSVGSKVAQISQFLYMAFAGGWQYFAFSTMKDKDYKYLMGNVWEILFAICTSLFLIVFLLKDIIFNLLFKGDYVRGVIVFPYLFFTPFLLMFYQILGTQYQIIKQTYLSPLTLSFGCLINIIFNYFLIPKYGIIGASISTVLGYFVSNLISIIIVVSIKKLVVFSWKAFLMIFIFIILFVIINMQDINFFTLSIICMYLLLIFLMYYQQAVKYYKEWR